MIELKKILEPLSDLNIHNLGPNIHGLKTDIQVNVYIGNTLSRLSFQN